ncbi:hypothetical protein GCM10028895_33740 [Pontibacter rugosus]
MNFLDTILGEILKVFRQEGIEANSDDDLISRLDIRQGTYRELFKDRNEMVRQVVLYDMQEQEKRPANAAKCCKSC